MLHLIQKYYDYKDYEVGTTKNNNHHHCEWHHQITLII